MTLRSEAREDDADLSLRHVTRHFPEHLARALLGPTADVAIIGWEETQVASRQRKLDRALHVKVGAQRRVLHAEWQASPRASLSFRVFEYHALLALALAAGARARADVPAVESVVVLLSGRAKPWPKEGEHRTSPPGAPFCGVRYRIEAVYQQTIAELEARNSPLWLVFAPLAVDASPEAMVHVVERLRSRTTPSELEELGAALVVMADVDKRKRGLRKVIVPLLGKEVVMRSWLRKSGEAAGKAAGRTEGKAAVVARQVERRLGRSLSETELAALARKIKAQGIDRVSDLVLDGDTAAIKAWLEEAAAA